jgi:hypothetical protein
MSRLENMFVAPCARKNLNSWEVVTGFLRSIKFRFTAAGALADLYAFSRFRIDRQQILARALKGAATLAHSAGTGAASAEAAGFFSRNSLFCSLSR